MKCTVLSTILVGLLSSTSYAADTPADSALRAAYPILEARRAERERSAEENKRPEKSTKVSLKAPPKAVVAENKTPAGSTKVVEKGPQIAATGSSSGTGASAFDPNAALLSTLPMAPAALSARKNELKQELIRESKAPSTEKPVAVASEETEQPAGVPLRVGAVRTPVGTSQVTLVGPFGNVLMRTLLSGEKVQLMVQYPGFGWEIFSDVDFKSTYRLQQTEQNCARFSRPGDTENFYDICLDKSKLRVRAVGDVESLT